MQNFVAFPTKSDQVGLSIVAKGAAPYHVVNIEILGAPTFLTPPAVAFQDFPAQPRIELRFFPNSRPFLRRRIIHVARSS